MVQDFFHSISEQDIFTTTCKPGIASHQLIEVEELPGAIKMEDG